MMGTVNSKLDQILDLIEFIHTEIPDGNALCQFVTLRSLNEVGATHAFIAELKPGGLIRSEEHTSELPVTDVSRMPSSA